MQKMEQRRVDRQREEMTTRDGAGIMADEELKDMARVAAQNGYVESRGQDAGGITVVESTKSRPARYPQLLDEEIETVQDVLARVSAKRAG